MYLFNFLIMPLYIISIFFSISNSSWILIWMGMELNLISFIFMIMSHPINIMKTESSMKYFLIQSIGSLMFLMTINSNMIFYNEKSFIFALIPPLALILKGGIAPLHFWTPNIVSKFPYLTLLMFLTFQKLIPIFILFSSWYWLTSSISLINIAVGSLAGISQSSFTKMMVFSSINTIGWLFMSMMESFYLFMFYFTNYFILSFFMMKFIFNLQIKWIIQIKSYKSSIKWYYFSTMMSMSGFPPFMGFTPKWLVIKTLHKFNLIIIMVSICLSIFTLYFYLKSSLMLITNYSVSKKWKLLNSVPSNLMLNLNLMGPALFYIFN